MSLMLDIAIMYQRELGVAVLPVCSPDWTGVCWRCKNEPTGAGKHPLIAWRGLRKQAAGVEQLTAWWRRWPDANIAGLMGAVSGGRIAIDIDPRNGGDVAAVTAAYDLADCWRQATGGGGEHLIGRVAPAYQRKGQLVGWTGVDVQGEGSYILLAPSLHRSGKLYEGLCYVDATWTDAKLLAALPGASVRREPRADVPIIPVGDKQRRAFGVAVLRRAAARVAGAESGERNSTLNKAAFVCARYAELCGLRPADIERELQDAANRVGIGAEARATIHSGLWGGLGKPIRSLPIRG